MKTYKLQIRENEEYGSNGIMIMNSLRDYHEAHGGNIVAHDIMEHTVKPHADKYIDELQALGGLLWLRVESGYVVPKRLGRLDENDLISDIRTLLLTRDQELGDNWEIERFSCKSREVSDKVKNIVLAGWKGYCGETFYSTGYEDASHQGNNYDLDSITAWIVNGYKLIKKRFGHHNTLCLCELFDDITRKCDDWLKIAELYDEAELKVCFSNLYCELNIF